MDKAPERTLSQRHANGQRVRAEVFAIADHREAQAHEFDGSSNSMVHELSPRAR